jgi:hypothetical protein
MNNCRTVASELMPAYFESCFSILDTTWVITLRQETPEWLESTRFRRIRIIYEAADKTNHETDASVTKNEDRRPNTKGNLMTVLDSAVIYVTAGRVLKATSCASAGAEAN